MQEPNSPEWIEPPPPVDIKKIEEPPRMSEVATLGNIFFEPGNTFEDLRRKPRFIIAGLVIIIAATLFQVLLIQKVGLDNIARARIESSSFTENLSKEDKEKSVQQQSSPIVEGITYVSVPIVVIITFLIGGLIYWLGANAMGGSAKFLQGVSVWVYSSLPPTLLWAISNLIVLILKSVDDIDLATAQGGVMHANPGFFMDGKSSPVLAAVLSGIDLFTIYGWVLAAIGLQKIAKISSGSAWAIVLILGLVRLTATVIWAAAFG